MTVLTDGAASLPPGTPDALGVHVVPMTIALGDEVLAEGELSPAAVVEKNGTEPIATSAPSPGAFLEVLGAAGGGPAVVATVARGMSASYESALTAASYREDHVAVVDTQSAAGGQGLVVLAAARTARGGGTIDEVVSAAHQVAGRVRLVAFLDRLDYLARSGRVPQLAARAGRSLDVRALFEFSNGRVRARRPARSLSGAIGRIVAACRAERGPGSRLHAAVLDGGTGAGADTLLAEVLDLSPDADVYSASFSSVMVAHTGPAVTGLAWWWEPGPQGAPGP